MATQNIAYLTEQLKAGLADGMEKLKDFSETAKDRFESARAEIKHGLETTQAAAKDAVNGVRNQARKRPFTALAATAITGLALGITLGWLAGHKRRS